MPIHQRAFGATALLVAAGSVSACAATPVDAIDRNGLAKSESGHVNWSLTKVDHDLVFRQGSEERLRLRPQVPSEDSVGESIDAWEIWIPSKGRDESLVVAKDGTLQAPNDASETDNGHEEVAVALEELGAALAQLSTAHFDDRLCEAGLWVPPATNSTLTHLQKSCAQYFFSHVACEASLAASCDYKIIDDRCWDLTLFNLAECTPAVREWTFASDEDAIVYREHGVSRLRVSVRSAGLDQKGPVWTVSLPARSDDVLEVYSDTTFAVQPMADGVRREIAVRLRALGQRLAETEDGLEQQFCAVGLSIEGASESSERLECARAFFEDVAGLLDNRSEGSLNNPCDAASRFAIGCGGALPPTE